MGSRCKLIPLSDLLIYLVHELCIYSQVRWVHATPDRANCVGSTYLVQNQLSLMVDERNERCDITDVIPSTISYNTMSVS